MKASMVGMSKGHLLDLNELRAALWKSRTHFGSVAVFSAFANMLMLTGPLFMLQVYDRVLSSRSVETLVALTSIVVFLYFVMGVLDYVRGRILVRISIQFHERLNKRIFDALLGRSGATRVNHSQARLSDLELIQRFIASPGPIAVFDICWTPIFLFGIFVFHPLLGYFALVGAAFLIGLTLFNQVLSGQLNRGSNRAAHQTAMFGQTLQSHAENLRSTGLIEGCFARWSANLSNKHRLLLSSSDITNFFTVFIKTFRFFLQSAILALGALLFIRSELSPGAMIASSILMGRALAPIETAISQWPQFQHAREAWKKLTNLLNHAPNTPKRTLLPSPKAKMDVTALTVIAKETRRPILKDVSFSINPGEALAVIGPSAAGKSTLAQAITGTLAESVGSIRLDGADIDQYSDAQLASYIGYLPQRVTLFDGTIAENIARLSMQPDNSKVVAAAKKAAAHEMILDLPNGYDTTLTEAGSQLSGGQIQRIALARALYSNPVILILDEPNSNLDSRGTEALNQTIRRMKSDGRSVIVMAHRPAAIRECDSLLVLKGGCVDAYGPRDVVLKTTVSNHQKIECSLQNNVTLVGVK